MKLSSETPRNPAEYRLGNTRRNSRDTGPEKCAFHSHIGNNNTSSIVRDTIKPFSQQKSLLKSAPVTFLRVN
jgi:hypothetical protein